MNTTQLYKQLQKLVDPVSKKDFLFDLLLAYSIPKAQVTQLRNGTNNRSNVEGQLILARKVLFQPADSDSLFTTMESLRNDQRSMRHNPRFFVVTDFKSLLAYDTKVDDTLDIRMEELPKNMEFFMPLAGRERYAEAQENPADVKAAERMARLYDEILRHNPDAEKDPDERHKLNVFLSRLLFCFFAEDTDIFPNNIFSKAIHELTKEDGSDLDTFLNDLFEVLNSENREGCIDQLCKFPYVNGGLFGDSYDVPKMTRRARRMIIECGALNWSEINPDIFGSMIQAVVDPEQRGELGMHYTSVPNIMKVIKPLFLNEFYEELEVAKGNQKKLQKLHKRIKAARFFDPACGSGNFLIITYKEIRKLEMLILEQLAHGVLGSMITLDHFYGIEIDDFAHEVATLSLWLAEHQMNVQFKEKFGDARPALPLREGGNIVCGNATLLDWAEVCPINQDSEVFVMGNPPYLGARMQNPSQKEELCKVFNGREEYKDSDYVSCWFVKGSDYILKSNSKFAFVATNSICQGEQVACIWPLVLNDELEIFFAHKSFKWANNAASNAGVACVIVGVRKKSKEKRFLFSKNEQKQVSGISPYLTEGKVIVVHPQKESISGLPHMAFGNMARDGGRLILSPDEKTKLIERHPEAGVLVKKLLGSQEFIKGIERWCLWIEDKHLELAKSIPEIQSRINEVCHFRTTSKAKTTQGYASILPPINKVALLR